MMADLSLGALPPAFGLPRDISQAREDHPAPFWEVVS